MSSPAVVTKPPPARGWFIVAGLIAMAAVAGSGIFVVARVQGLGDRLLQVVVPGEADLDLRDTGSYTIFHEYRSVVEGKIYYAISLSGLRVTVQPRDGQALKLVSPMATSRYAFSGRAGVSVYTFDVREPGIYRLTAAYENGRTEPQTVLTVGSGFVAGILETVMIALAIVFSGVGIAIGLIIVVVRARRRAQPPGA